MNGLSNLTKYRTTPKYLLTRLIKNYKDKNKYYKDLIVGKIIQKPIIRNVVKDGFKKYMDSIGKLGGQNKIPKIANDRKIASQLKNLNLIKKTSK